MARVLAIPLVQARARGVNSATTLASENRRLRSDKSALATSRRTWSSACASTIWLALVNRQPRRRSIGRLTLLPEIPASTPRDCLFDLRSEERTEASQQARHWPPPTRGLAKPAAQPVCGDPLRPPVPQKRPRRKESPDTLRLPPTSRPSTHPSRRLAPTERQPVPTRRPTPAPSRLRF